MASVLVGRQSGASIGANVADRLLGLVATAGSVAHPYSVRAAEPGGADAPRDLADAVHFLCMLHGRHPGVVDHAASRSVDRIANAWFDDATIAFVNERALLTGLAPSVGPVPSTPGSAGNEAAVHAQRHAIEMLSRSERNGCALGAALALTLDWHAVRPVLDAAAARLDLVPDPYRLDTPRILDLVGAVVTTPAMERALLFGAEQIVLQHHALWDLLEARHQARAAA